MATKAKQDCRKKNKCSVRINYLQTGERELPKREKTDNRLDPLDAPYSFVPSHSSIRKTNNGRRTLEQHKATTETPHSVPPAQLRMEDQTRACC